MNISVSNPIKTPAVSRLLLGLEVIEENGALLRLLTPVLDDNARAVDDLAGVALTVKLAYYIISTFNNSPGQQKVGRLWKTYKDQPTRPASSHQAP